MTFGSSRKGNLISKRPCRTGSTHHASRHATKPLLARRWRYRFLIDQLATREIIDPTLIVLEDR